MEENSPIKEKVELLKLPLPGGLIQALVTRTFVFSEDETKQAGVLIQSTICEDCYLEEYYDGLCLPVVRRGGETDQFFFIRANPNDPDNPYEYMIDRVSYAKALRISKRATTRLGRLFNRIRYPG